MASLSVYTVCVWHIPDDACCMYVLNLIQNLFVSSGYDVQSASTPDGVLYITGAPRYNHTGRVVIYRLNEMNKIVVSQILKGEQVSPLHVDVWNLSSVCLKSLKTIVIFSTHWV